MANTAVAAQIRDAVAAHVNDYITGERSVTTRSTYAGATAKALVFAQLAGVAPTSFGGVDLVSRLESRAARAGAWSTSRLRQRRSPVVRRAGLTTRARTRQAAVSRSCSSSSARRDSSGSPSMTHSCAVNTCPGHRRDRAGGAQPSGSEREAGSGRGHRQGLDLAALDPGRRRLLRRRRRDGAPNTNSTGLAGVGARRVRARSRRPTGPRPTSGGSRCPPARPAP